MPTMSMELTVVIPFVLAPLVALLLHHQAAAAAAAADVDAPAPRNGGGFSLRVVPSPGLNRTIRVDGDGFLHLQEQDTPQPSALRPPVSALEGLTYSVLVTVGTGQVPPTYSLALDTASSMTWMQCQPCSPSFPQTPPPFDPSSSPSLLPVDPTNNLCRDPNHPTGKCDFHVSRRDGAVAEGFLVHDTIAFASGDAGGEPYKLPGFVFGCAHHTAGFPSHRVLAGVLSLGKRDGSLTMELRRRGVYRFSYCLFGPQSPDRHGFLRFGDDAPGTGHMQVVNILFKNYHTAEYSGYFVELAGLSVAETKVRGVDRGTFRRSRSGDGGTVIDAGTGTMVMVQAAYDRLVQRVEEHLGQLGLPLVRGSEYRLCLRGATNAVWAQLPTVTLHFGDRGVDMVLRAQQMFVAVSQDICLAVTPGDMTIIGAMQQLDRRFTYDLSLGAVFFATEQCRLDSSATAQLALHH